MRRRLWKHRTKVYKDGPSWRWKCCLCGFAVPGYWYGSLTQQDAFGIAVTHAALGGYDLE